MSKKHVSSSTILSLSLSLLWLFHSEATVEADLLYMVQPSRMYFGDNINVFSRGEHSIHLYCYICYIESPNSGVMDILKHGVL